MHQRPFGLLVGLSQVFGIWAATVTYNWEVSWVTAAPDGFSRPVIGINGQWPNPAIDCNLGDTVVVNLKNSLGNETTGLHFHGINQKGSPFMDGTSMNSQCPIVPGASFTYTFVADVPGTLWYHSHNMGQYPDGLRGPLIVHDPNDPYAGQYDQEVTLTISDWYHSQTLDLTRAMLQPSNKDFAPPAPNSLIVNEGLNRNIQFDAGKTYRVRIINWSALAASMLHFNSHTMDVIEIDGSYVQKQQVDTLRIDAGQRYDVLISSGRNDARSNFPYVVAMDANKDYLVDASWPLNQTGYLVTDPRLPMGATDVVQAWNPFDDTKFIPYDLEPALGPVTKTWKLDLNFGFDINGYPRAYFNNQTYISQKTPALYSASTTGASNTDPSIYGSVIPFVASYGDVVELVINNLHDGLHPMHLHGHQFQMITRAPSGAGVWPGFDNNLQPTPAKRDTLWVNANSYAVLRFRADNPGVFLFHCHMEWHVEMGLTATLIEAPEKLRGLHFPQDHLAACSAAGVPTTGNAAGNTADLMSTEGFVTVPPTQYYGSLWPNPEGADASGKKRTVRRKPGGQSWNGL